MSVFRKTLCTYYINDSLRKHPWFVLDRVAALTTPLVYAKCECAYQGVRNVSFLKNVSLVLYQ